MAIGAYTAGTIIEFKPAALILPGRIDHEIRYADWNLSARSEWEALTIHLIVPKADFRRYLPQANHTVKSNCCSRVVRISRKGKTHAHWRRSLLVGSNFGWTANDKLLVLRYEALTFPSHQSGRIKSSNRWRNWNTRRGAFIDIGLALVAGGGRVRKYSMIEFMRPELFFNLGIKLKLLSVLEVLQLLTAWNLPMQRIFQGTQLADSSTVFADV